MRRIFGALAALGMIVACGSDDGESAGSAGGSGGLAGTAAIGGGAGADASGATQH